LSKLLLIVIASYLLGSIPFGYLLVRLFYGEDVRKSGSGNIGATNVSRKSPLLGILTLLLDAAKGWASVVIGSFLIGDFVSSPTQVAAMSLAALFSVLGHLFPVWLKFRGGKGVATGLGAFVMIARGPVVIAVGIFLLVVLAFRYVSLGSIIAVALFPSLVWSFHDFGDSWLALAFMGIASLLIVLKHYANITRLVAGTENRIGAKKSASGDSPR
jgi:acyl phosphate:glycerol-3-phosphate acyltransferase